MAVLDNVDLYYPGARGWMWDYCVYLGGYTDSSGKEYDLGIYVHPCEYSKKGVSAAIVYGNNEGDYLSGEWVEDDECWNSEVYKETWRRARVLGLLV